MPNEIRSGWDRNEGGVGVPTKETEVWSTAVYRGWSDSAFHPNTLNHC